MAGKLVKHQGYRLQWQIQQFCPLSSRKVAENVYRTKKRTKDVNLCSMLCPWEYIYLAESRFGRPTVQKKNNVDQIKSNVDVIHPLSVLLSFAHTFAFICFFVLQPILCLLSDPGFLKIVGNRQTYQNIIWMSRKNHVDYVSYS